nr:MAG TPA: hypothetical protein [Caudoviricetes sp.]
MSFFTYFSNYNSIVTFNFLQKVFYSNSLVDLFHKILSDFNQNPNKEHGIKNK